MKKIKKTNKERKRTIWKYAFAMTILILGVTLGNFNSDQEFLGFNSVGNWLIYVGFIMLIVITLQISKNKKRIVDERAQFIGMKASQVTYLAIIILAFIIMIIDGLNTISIPYSFSCS